MLNIIVGVISLMKQTCYWCLVLSYKTGQSIVYGINILVRFILHTNESVGAVLKVLFEDFLIFLSDVLQKILLILTVIYNIFEAFFGFVTTIFESIKYILTTVIEAIIGTYNAIFSVIGKTFLAFTQLIVMIKLFFALLGSGIWFSVTLIPGFILYICTISTYFVGSLIDELCNFMVYSAKRVKLLVIDVYEFATDTPLESLGGLFIGACVLYLISKYKRELSNHITSTLQTLKQTIHRLCLRLSFQQVVVVDHLNYNDEPSDASDTSSGRFSEDESDSAERRNEEKLCLICQCRVKCIVMIPCKHVCVCSVCNLRLRNYNRTCPLCRTVVRKTMKVYV